MRYFVLTLFMLLSGCTMTSEIMPFGKDTYTITGTSEVGMIQAKQAALQKATDFCNVKGQTMQPVNVQQGSETEGFITSGAGGIYGGSSTWSNYDLVFKCLS